MYWKENRQRILLLIQLTIRNQVCLLADTMLISAASPCRCLNGVTSCSLLIGFCFIGEIQYRQRLEDIRLLKLEIKKLRREKNILTKSVANVEDLR